MKLLKLYHLFLLIFILSISQVEAQNLSFSNPKLIESADTVPIGKTYKVESFVFSREIPWLPTGTSWPYQSVQDDCILLDHVGWELLIGHQKFGNKNYPFGYPLVP
jgi:hypothetical protein